MSSTLNLFNRLSDYANLQSALLKKQATELTLTRAKQQIALDVAQSFLQVILDNKIVDIARKNLQESQAREKLLEAQTKLGARSLSDLFRQQAQTSSDESLLVKTGLRNRTDLKAADLTADAAHWDSKVSWSGYLPKLDLVGSAVSGGRYLTTQIVNDVNVVPSSQSDLGYQFWTQINYNIGINLSWNLFDRFNTQQNWVTQK